jgi:hypothetical protein
MKHVQSNGGGGQVGVRDNWQAFWIMQLKHIVFASVNIKPFVHFFNDAVSIAEIVLFVTAEESQVREISVKTISFCRDSKRVRLLQAPFRLYFNGDPKRSLPKIYSLLTKFNASVQNLTGYGFAHGVDGGRQEMLTHSWWGSILGSVRSEIPRKRPEENIRMDLTEMWCESGKYVALAEDHVHRQNLLNVRVCYTESVTIIRVCSLIRKLT